MPFGRIEEALKSLVLNFTTADARLNWDAPTVLVKVRDSNLKKLNV